MNWALFIKELTIDELFQRELNKDDTGHVWNDHIFKTQESKKDLFQKFYESGGD